MSDRILVINPNSTEAVTRGIDAAMEPLRMNGGPAIECVTLKDDKKKGACVKEMDEYYAATVRKGRVRNGAVYMPPFEGTLNQEAVWAIKAYLETRREKPL